ncbi:methylated-DNA--[protein]-cysteine S-methyltransferase [Treponema primitia ZAS-2]|uniref:Methylated-DNA--protein-cysteine methyltransferase n=1 Tax=Treponema primitia (strain ATCC BAA-887 / DSM 12427 / ZAS-2) TaxID=545694 RepID=F5YHZ4_TREPZ|nr:methylated-DNA--[protein]-cysteine S-methyltransferase [Treponema primitia]AEF86070.1 methylated-DNA--[protein]-cysteine S-methyltransferase [Treponema primitia ZAS-2]
MEYIQKLNSPVGILTLASDGQSISGLWIEGQKYFARSLEKETCEKHLPVFGEAKKWLDIYFSGKEPDFMPPLLPKGTMFQKSIWNILCTISYGNTSTYGELAKKFESLNNGKRTAARAVGSAVGRNPISILIPCHRILGKDGGLTGYAGGVDIKEKLLQLEDVDQGVKSHG